MTFSFVKLTSTLKMEAAHFTDMSADTCQNTRRDSPELWESQISTSHKVLRSLILGLQNGLHLWAFLTFLMQLISRSSATCVAHPMAIVITIADECVTGSNGAHSCRSLRRIWKNLLPLSSGSKYRESGDSVFLQIVGSDQVDCTASFTRIH